MNVIPLNALNLHEGETVSVLANVLHVDAYWNPDSQSICTAVEFSDFSGTATFQVEGPHTPALRDQQVIQATVTPIAGRRDIRGVMHTALPMPYDVIPNPFWCLPQKLTPVVARPALAQLTQAALSLSTPDIATFIGELVLYDYVPFLTAPAGLRHHHAYPGGLLVHYAGIWDRLQPWLTRDDAEDQDLALACVIAHDIGKIRKCGTVASNPVNRFQTHEMLGLEMVNGPLRRMGEVWPEGAARLNRVIYWMLMPNPHRQFLSQLGRAIAQADREDAREGATGPAA
ncbi:MAG: hypothetical protein ABF296_04730 [Oceanococcaceae bacterium]